jgi:hypothetical protein
MLVSAFRMKRGNVIETHERADDFQEPSEMFGWPGPDAALTMQSERTGIENKWLPLQAALLN